MLFGLGMLEMRRRIFSLDTRFDLMWMISSSKRSLEIFIVVVVLLCSLMGVLVQTTRDDM